MERTSMRKIKYYILGIWLQYIANDIMTLLHKERFIVFFSKMLLKYFVT